MMPVVHCCTRGRVMQLVMSSRTREVEDITCALFASGCIVFDANTSTNVIVEWCKAVGPYGQPPVTVVPDFPIGPIIDLPPPHNQLVE